MDNIKSLSQSGAQNFFAINDSKRRRRPSKYLAFVYGGKVEKSAGVHGVFEL
jgi:hypothetical protein